ncbi:MAG TPA: NAD(P)/FAD-dependent oxidoreductase [Microthrixaceae bacterium]|nr:NAD(P)/FAD-dependent oxidoreductase [Microthrixaceae bacterium]
MTESDSPTPDGPSSADVDAAMAAARERYQAERAKRVRSDGNAQYGELTGDFAEFDRDPFADPDHHRDPLDEDVEVLVIGCGFAGMLTTIELKARGFDDVRMVDRAGDFGGTWYWNRYPGCMCDVESYTYLPLLEETGYMPTEKYASAVEIFSYAQLVGRHYDLYPHALFHTEVVEAVWDEAALRWRVRTNWGDTLSCRFLVTAGGILHKAKLPGIAGISRFKGRAFHTSRWNYEVTGGAPGVFMDKLADKRVAVIGTGATAVQVVPRVAEAAQELFVFQRTPSAVGQRDNGPTDEAWFASLEPGWHAERVKNFTEAVTGKKPEVDLVDDGWTHVMWDDTQTKFDDPEVTRGQERSDFLTMEEIRQRVTRIVEDPETAARLQPWYGKHCKRVCFHDEYLPAFNRPNVHLVDTDGHGVDEITENGVVACGVEYPVDVIVFASGFEVTTDLEHRLGFDPEGRGGIRMSERWSDGAHSLHGILSAEFPNLLMISLVQAGFGTNFLHFLSKSAEHVAWIIATCEERGIATIEATPEAEEEWYELLLGVAMGIAGYSTRCTPGYYNSEQGRDSKTARNLVYTGSLLEYAEFLERWRGDGSMPGALIADET